MANPYSLTFGMEPKEYIKRPEDFLNVLNAFSDDSPENRCLIITGVRGSGKTVFSFRVIRLLQKQRKVAGN